MDLRTRISEALSDIDELHMLDSSDGRLDGVPRGQALPNAGDLYVLPPVIAERSSANDSPGIEAAVSAVHAIEALERAGLRCDVQPNSPNGFHVPVTER